MNWIDVDYSEKYIMGIDEVGRGPLFGDVVAAAVIMPKNEFIVGVNDSKKLSEKKRELFFDVIMKRALAVGLGAVSAEMIDEINILEATKLAMKTAAENASIFLKPELILVDAVRLDTGRKTEAIIHGDMLSYNIACASIVAKVSRDRLCYGWDRRFPDYGLIKNKGYGTEEHRAALKKSGATPLHRKSFIGRLI